MCGKSATEVDDGGAVNVEFRKGKLPTPSPKCTFTIPESGSAGRAPSREGQIDTLGIGRGVYKRKGVRKAGLLAQTLILAHNIKKLGRLSMPF